MMTNFRKAASALLFLTLCLGCAKNEPWEPRTISVRDVYISGDWKDYIKIEDGDYLLEDQEGRPLISLRLTLNRAFSGAMANPAETLRLDALSAGGSALGKEFRVDSEAKFNDFVRGQEGVTTAITFTAMMRRDDKWFPNVAGFDAVTREPSRQTAAGQTVQPANPANVVTRDTRTDPNFENRTQARTGPRVVAVPQLTGTPIIPKDLIIATTGAVTGHLLYNKGVRTVVDYSRIAEAQEQLKFEAGDWSNPSKYAEIGRALNVDTIAVGTISDGGKIIFIQTYTISVQLIDIATLSVAGAFTVSSVQRVELSSELEKAIKRMKVQL
jgi:hypothetical protein